MATDVSGTIHIIAEVMGEANSPVTGTGSRTSAKEKRDRKATTIGVLGMEIELKTIIKYLTVGGIIANSKIIGTSVSFIFRMLGILTDVFFAGPLKILLPALKDLFGAFTVMAQLIDGETTWADVWSNLKAHWAEEWTEGGVSGLIKEAFADIAGLFFLTAFFLTWVLGPGAGVWIFKNVFALTGAQFAVNTLGYALGLKKVKLSSARKGTKAARAGRWLRQGALNAGRMVLNLFPKGALVMKFLLVLAALGGAAILAASDFVEELANGGWKQIAFEGINLVSFGTWQKMSDALGLDAMKGNLLAIILPLFTLISPITALAIGFSILTILLGVDPNEAFRNVFSVISGAIERAKKWLADLWRMVQDSGMGAAWDAAGDVVKPKSYKVSNPLSTWFRKNLWSWSRP